MSASAPADPGRSVPRPSARRSVARTVSGPRRRRSTPRAPRRPGCRACTAWWSRRTDRRSSSTTRRARPAGRVTNVKSVSKSVISTLVGIAIERRLIPGVRQPIATYFPELARDADPRKRRITIEDLLTMRSGLISTSFDNYGAWVGSRNWVDYVLRRPMVADPGEDMEYSTGNTHLLSAILTKATKQSTWAFAQQQLGTPLGFTISRWPRDPQGIYFGGNDMLLSPAQMLSIGQLYLNRGRAGSRQLVPAAWVDASCTGLGRSRFNPGSDLRLRLVVARFRRPPGLLRLGLRRPVHHRLSRLEPDRGHDLVHRGRRRAARSSPADLRHHRAAGAAGSVTMSHHRSLHAVVNPWIGLHLHHRMRTSPWNT